MIHSYYKVISSDKTVDPVHLGGTVITVPLPPFDTGDDDDGPLPAVGHVDHGPGQHQPLLHRHLHLRDAPQDVRPRQVLLQGTHNF